MRPGHLDASLRNFTAVPVNGEQDSHASPEKAEPLGSAAEPFVLWVVPTAITMPSATIESQALEFSVEIQGLTKNRP